MSCRVTALVLAIAVAVPTPPVDAGERDIVYEDQKILASDGAQYDLFGWRVATWAGTAIVGAKEEDELGTNSGSAYVLTRDASGDWVEAQKLVASDGADQDDFGRAVAIHGDTTVVGADLNDDFGQFSGSAYVYGRNPAGSWIEVAKLLASDGAAFDHFGHSVAVHGGTVAVGAEGADGVGVWTGAAYVFERDETRGWQETAKLVPSDGGPEDTFGHDLALGDSIVAVGANQYRIGGAGAVYVFERAGTGAWRETAKIQASDASEGDHFGGRVALDGDRLAAAATGVDDAGEWTGAVYLFERAAPGRWEEVAKLLASDAMAGDSFGVELALLGERLVVGATGADDFGLDGGAAYLFVRDASGWSEAAKLLPTDGAADDQFGYGLGIVDGSVLAGAYQDDDLGFNSGAVYAFSVGGCILEVGLERRVVRAGGVLRVALRLEHNRARTVTVPFRLWVEASDGSVVVGKTTEPITFEHGDVLRRELALRLPEEIPTGAYRLLVGVDRMQQGVAGAAAPFRVVE